MEHQTSLVPARLARAAQRRRNKDGSEPRGRRRWSVEGEKPEVSQRHSLYHGAPMQPLALRSSQLSSLCQCQPRPLRSTCLLLKAPFGWFIHGQIAKQAGQTDKSGFEEYSSGYCKTNCEEKIEGSTSYNEGPGRRPQRSDQQRLRWDPNILYTSEFAVLQNATSVLT